MSNASLQPILALLGHNMAANPSQYMVEKAFAHHGLDWRYLSLEVTPAGLGDAVRGMRSMGFRGGNCADPHKQTVTAHVDRLSQTAELSGVVNCLIRSDDQLVGENTEGKAFVQALAARMETAGKRVALLGAGRMARAIAIELALAGAAEITVINRNEPNARALAELITSRTSTQACFHPWGTPYDVPAEVALLVNATSLAAGDPDAPLPIVLDSLDERLVVADVNVNPPDTWLIHEANERGAYVLTGLETYISQAALNFLLWTGIEPDRTVLREAVEEFLEL